MAGDAAEAGPAAPSVAQVLRLRYQRAERWSWDELMEELIAERAGRKPSTDGVICGQSEAKSSGGLRLSRASCKLTP